jgi:hypothetical protein
MRRLAQIRLLIIEGEFYRPRRRPLVDTGTDNQHYAH